MEIAQERPALFWRTLRQRYRGEWNSVGAPGRNGFGNPKEGTPRRFGPLSPIHTTTARNSAAVRTVCNRVAPAFVLRRAVRRHYAQAHERTSASSATAFRRWRVALSR